MASQTAIDPSSVEIRRLTPGDLDLLRNIRAEALQKHPETFGSSEEDQGGDAMLAAYRHWLSGTILGAFEREALVGTAGFYVSTDKRSQHRGHIYTVYVREVCRGRGVGDRLMKELLSLAEACVDQVHLAVLLTATDAIRTYKRNGFEIYGIDPRVVLVAGVAYNKYLMMKRFR
jgi:ribosomal protein S18 acetylase RimI-like enzyme